MPGTARADPVSVLDSEAGLWVGYYAVGVWQANRVPCICGHIKGRHVSPLDWDSGYGDPEHKSPDYKKPGICRDCWGRCRHFIPLAESGRIAR